MAYIEIKNIYKSFTNPDNGSIEVLDNVNLDLETGEFVAIFGPNGCGKTTLLNVVAGLTEFDNGSISIDNKKPSESKIGFVFQNYSDSLFPWLKNIDNIAFSLDSSKESKKQKHQKIRDYVKDIGLGEMPLDKYPYQCSGGQQQLVALFRELIYKPDVLLMDEPFASLDYDRRIKQQENLLKSWEKTKSTILFISHELDEAIFLSDRIILLSQRPARIIDIYDIDLPRPRKIEMLEQEAFFKLKVPILKKFREVISK